VCSSECQEHALTAGPSPSATNRKTGKRRRLREAKIGTSGAQTGAIATGEEEHGGVLWKKTKSGGARLGRSKARNGGANRERNQEKTPRPRTLALEVKSTVAARVRQLATQQGVKRVGPQSTRDRTELNPRDLESKINTKMKSSDPTQKDQERTKLRFFNNKLQHTTRCKLEIFH
jgi:hypothetical protein